MNTRDILQDGLARLERGETLEQVLASCASRAERDELADLLALATNLRDAAPALSEASQARVQYQVSGALRALAPARGMSLGQTWGLRVALALVVVIVFGGGTFVAAAESAPGKPLFPAHAAFNEKRARITTDPGFVIAIHLDLAQDRVDDVRILKQRGGLNEAPIFLMVGATENLMVALENNPRSADRATLERAMRLAQAERALLRELAQTAPVERARRNAETLYQLSESWTPVLNRLLAQ
ncbi:MAG: hypothetical protein HZC40_25280 [Chloroflexi bacterium]|nr:hypothetical protein [Chloroflexota bacterium]